MMNYSMYVYAYVCMCVYTHTHIYVCVCVCSNILVLACVSLKMVLWWTEGCWKIKTVAVMWNLCAAWCSTLWTY